MTSGFATSPIHADPKRVTTKDDLAAALQSLKTTSSASFRVLAEAVDLPTTTVHGWFSGRHLPYTRHNDAFAELLLQFDIVNPGPWLDALNRARAAQGTSTNPYRGLEPYDATQSESFFGRDDLANEVAEQVIASSGVDSAPVMLVGPSGSGKTSLLRAGLLRALLKHSADWTLEYVALGTSPLQELSDAASALHASTTRSARTLVIDQFEQLLTADGPTIDAAIEQMRHVARANITIVIGLRADHYEQASRYEWLHAGLSSQQVLMSPPSIEDLSKIITEPAARVGRHVEPALLSTLITELRSYLAGPRPSGALPHVSHVLFKVAEEAGSGNLSLDHYNSVGGLNGALSKSAEDAYLSLSSEEQDRCRRMFSLLVRLSPEGAPTRRVVSATDVDDLVGDSHAIEPVLVAFTTSRIIVADQDSLQLSHESVLGAWDRLADWIEDDRNALVAERRIQARSDLWSETGEEPEALLAGSALLSATEVLQNPTASSRLREVDHEFLTLSRHRQDRAEARRLRARRILIALAVVAGVMALLATIFAVGFGRSADQAQEARAESESRELASQAALVAASDPSLSRQLEVLAYDTYPSLQARSGLIGATAGVQSSRHLGLSGPTALATSPSGDRFAYSNSEEGTIRIMDRNQSGGFTESVMLVTPQPDLSTYGLAFSNDGSELASTGKSGEVSLWDLDNPSDPVILDASEVEFYGSVYSLEIDRATSQLYAAGKGGGIGIWDLEESPETTSNVVVEAEVIAEVALATESALFVTRLDNQSIKIWDRDDTSKPLATLPPPQDVQVNSTEISPDGRLLLVGHAQGTVSFWDLTDPTEPTRQDRELDAFDGFVNHLRFSPTGSSIVGTASNGEVAIWDAETLTERGRVTFPTLGLNVRFLNDHEFVAVIGDGSARTFDLRDLALGGTGRNIWSVAFSDAGRLLVGTGRSARVLDIVEEGTGVIVAEVTAPEGLALSGASTLSPNGRHVALGTFTGEVLLASAAEPHTVKVVHKFEGFGSNLAFSDDGRILAATSDAGDLAFFTMDDGVAQLRSAIVLDDEPFGISIHPDNNRLIVGLGSGAVQLLDIGDLTDVRVIGQVQTGTTVAYGVDFHPSGSLFATSNSDSSVLLWNLETFDEGEPLLELEGPRDRVFTAEFSRDGTQLAGASSDGVAWVWRAEGGEFAPEAHYAIRTSKDDLHIAVFTPDGRALVGGGAETHVFHWILDEEAARQQICATSGASITSEEWLALVPDRPFEPPCARS